MTDYTEQAALGVANDARREVESDEDEPNVPSLLKGVDDVEIEDIPEGDIDDLMEETFATDVSDVQKASVTEPRHQPEPEEEEPSYTELIALAEHDPSAIDPDAVALEDLRKRAERGQLQDPEFSDFGGESVIEAIERATDSVGGSGINKEQTFREALAHAMEMATTKQEAAQLAGDYVLKAVDDKKLAVKARSKALQGYQKARQYVSDPSEAPNDVNCKEGPNGALYYDPDERGRGNNETTGPVDNDMLEMDADELTRAMDIDPTDPDESLGDVKRESSASEAVEKIAEAFDVDPGRVERFVKQARERGVSDSQTVLKQAEVVFGKQEPDEPIFDDRNIHGMISTASDAFDPDSGNANTVINAITEFAPPGVNRGDVSEALDGIFGEEDGVPVDEVASRLDGVIDGPFSLEGVDLRDFYGMISTMSAAVDPEDAAADTIIDAVTDVAPPGNNRGDVSEALSGLFTEEEGESVAEVGDRLSDVFGGDEVENSVEKEGGYPDDWPFSADADGVDTCARRFGPEDHIDNARAFCENWYVETQGEIPEGAEYVVDEAEVENADFSKGVREDWEERLERDEDPCWDGYTMVGTQEDGSPRCVPEEDVDNYDPDKAKSRRYVSDPDDAPDDVEVQEGQRGGYYYETEDLPGEEDEEDAVEGLPEDPDLDDLGEAARDIVEDAGSVEEAREAAHEMAQDADIDPQTEEDFVIQVEDAFWEEADAHDSEYDMDEYEDESPFSEGEDPPESFADEIDTRMPSVAEMEEFDEEQLADARDYFNADVTDEEIEEGDPEDIAYDIAATAELDTDPVGSESLGEGEEVNIDTERMGEVEGEVVEFNPEFDEVILETDDGEELLVPMEDITGINESTGWEDDGGEEETEEEPSGMPGADEPDPEPEAHEVFGELVDAVGEDAAEEMFQESSSFEEFMDAARTVFQDDELENAISNAVERRIEEGPDFKSRRYVSDPDDAPDDVEVQEGDRGGYYYETNGSGTDESGEEDGVRPENEPEELWQDAIIPYDELNDEEVVEYADHLTDLHEEAREEGDDDTMREALDELMDVEEQIRERGIEEDADHWSVDGIATFDALLRRAVEKRIDKDRRYVSDPDDAPDDVDVQQGPQGGYYYETDDLPGEEDAEDADDDDGWDSGRTEAEDLTADVMTQVASIDESANITADMEDGRGEVTFEVFDEDAAADVMTEVASMDGTVNISGDRTEEGVEIDFEVDPEVTE